MTDTQIGKIVRAHYNSGIYIGEVIEDRGDRFLIKVLAVHKHPMQGDLHNPGKVEDVFFHERKALAYNEKMNVAKPAVHPFEGELPSYKTSLEKSVNKLKDKLAYKDTPFNKKALKTLEELEEKHY
ncbi:kinase-associated lipoprotein B [Virgibacillus necropolis]|uniref:Kinase n=1 Tax=Virgibacillus necropolis TaxID=163877 RepID=A0A221MB94_9BACI|nr:kinase-associated lipoprotein B [Virgibacillus necropolis]ASN04892.1 kinase [Virgibacillus necropolis]